MAPAPLLAQVADRHDPDGPVTLYDRWTVSCCVLGPRRHAKQRTSWRTARRARIVLAAHLAAAHGAVVPPESLRESTPHACTVCTGDALFENLGLSEDELDALMSGECPSCDGTGIAYRHPDPASAAR